eukprot:351140-Chlamydomonas_euryale.AAC.27
MSYLAVLPRHKFRKGHRGRGVWRSCASLRDGLLATGGADGSVKVWHLDAWLPQKYRDLGVELAASAARARVQPEYSIRCGSRSAVSGNNMLEGLCPTSCMQRHQLSMNACGAYKL